MQMRPLLFGLAAVFGLAGFHARSADAPGEGQVAASPPRTVISPKAAVEAATAALDVAQAVAAKAERDLNRQRNLMKDGATLQASLDKAQAVFDRAGATRDAADTDLRRALKEAAGQQR